MTNPTPPKAAPVDAQLAELDSRLDELTDRVADLERQALTGDWPTDDPDEPAPEPDWQAVARLAAPAFDNLDRTVAAYIAAQQALPRPPAAPTRPEDPAELRESARQQLERTKVAIRQLAVLALAGQ